jgi:hypothetical protein
MFQTSRPCFLYSTTCQIKPLETTTTKFPFVYCLVCFTLEWKKHVTWKASFFPTFIHSFILLSQLNSFDNIRQSLVFSSVYRFIHTDEVKCVTVKICIMFHIYILQKCLYSIFFMNSVTPPPMFHSFIICVKISILIENQLSTRYILSDVYIMCSLSGSHHTSSCICHVIITGCRKC